MSDIIFLKQLAIRKMVVDLAIPEKTIELVIAHSFNRARQAFHHHSSIEISGFGKFVVGKSRMKFKEEGYLKNMPKWEKEIADPNVSEAVKDIRRIWLEKGKRELEIINRLKDEKA